VTLRASMRLIEASERVCRTARADFHSVRAQPWNDEAAAETKAMVRRRSLLALCLVLMSEVEERRVT
jgi:hypothetical protein